MCMKCKERATAEQTRVKLKDRERSLPCWGFVRCPQPASGPCHQPHQGFGDSQTSRTWVPGVQILLGFRSTWAVT